MADSDFINEPEVPPTPSNEAKPEGVPPGMSDADLLRLAERLRPMYASAKVPPPDEVTLTAPTLYVGAEKMRPPSYVIAEDLAKLLQGKHLLFRRAGEVVTIDVMTGECEVMLPPTFVTWV